MEVYKTTCSNCDYERIWVGYKTELGKTPEQVLQMKKEATTCKACGSTSANTDVARIGNL